MTNETKTRLIKIGDFFFKWRNYVFPAIILLLFVSFPVPHTYFGTEDSEEIKDSIAIALVLSGLAFRGLTIGWAYIKRGGLNKEVYADTLVQSGLFGVCRNPLYVGNVMVYTGLFILHGHPVVMILGISLFVFIYISIIAAEEFFLRNKFGAQYDAYCAEVPRWLPRFGRYKQSIQGMDFSFKRALFKDYSTIFNAAIAMLVVETLEHHHLPDAHHGIEMMLRFCIGMALVAFVILVIVKYFKKTSNVKV